MGFGVQVSLEFKLAWVKACQKGFSDWVPAPSPGLPLGTATHGRSTVTPPPEK